MIVTVRLIRSFEHRNIQHLVIKDVNGDMSVKDFKSRIREVLKTKAGLPPPIRNYSYDTLKISHQPHRTKTNNLIIDIENDELILRDENTLSESAVENETEVSYFNFKDYEKFQQHPELNFITSDT